MDVSEYFLNLNFFWKQIFSFD